MNHVYVPPTSGGLKKLFNLLLWGLDAGAAVFGMARQRDGAHQVGAGLGQYVDADYRFLPARFQRMAQLFG